MSSQMFFRLKDICGKVPCPLFGSTPHILYVMYYKTDEAGPSSWTRILDKLSLAEWDMNYDI